MGKGLVWVGGGRFLAMVEMPVAAGGEMDILGKWGRSAQQKLQIEVTTEIVKGNLPLGEVRTSV